MPRPKQRTPELREQVLHRAVAILAHEGVGGLTARSVAAAADTSTPAVYELFGDKAGLVREVFVEGFRRLGDRLATLAPTDDAPADLARVAFTVRDFLREQPVLGQVMFSQPFADFDPGPDDLAAAASVRTAFTAGAQCGLDVAEVEGDATDIAHLLLGVVLGLWSQERAGWLGTSAESVERRWQMGVHAAIDGALGR